MGALNDGASQAAEFLGSKHPKEWMPHRPGRPHRERKGRGLMLGGAILAKANWNHTNDGSLSQVTGFTTIEDSNGWVTNDTLVIPSGPRFYRVSLVVTLSAPGSTVHPVVASVFQNGTDLPDEQFLIRGTCPSGEEWTGAASFPHRLDGDDGALDVEITQTSGGTLTFARVQWAVELLA